MAGKTFRFACGLLLALAMLCAAGCGGNERTASADQSIDALIGHLLYVRTTARDPGFQWGSCHRTSRAEALWSLPKPFLGGALLEHPGEDALAETGAGGAAQGLWIEAWLSSHCHPPLMPQRRFRPGSLPSSHMSGWPSRLGVVFGQQLGYLRFALGF